MVKVLSNVCVPFVKILLSFLVIVDSRKCQSVSLDISSTNNSLFNVEHDCCQPSSSTSTSTLNISKLIEDPSKMSRNIFNSFVTIESTAAPLKINMFVSSTNEQLQRSGVERLVSKRNDRSNDDNGNVRTNTDPNLKLSIEQDKTTADIDNLREFQITKNERGYLHEKRLFILDNDTDVVASIDENSDNPVVIRVKRDPTEYLSQVFHKTNRKKKITKERRACRSGVRLRGNDVSLEKSFVKPTVSKSYRLLQARSSEEMSKLFGPKAITGNDRAAVATSIELETLPKEIGSSANPGLVETGMRDGREKIIKTKYDEDRSEEGCSDVLKKCRGHRAVRSIEEVRKLAERLVTKVNELQYYLTLEKNGRRRKRDRRRGRKKTVSRIVRSGGDSPHSGISPSMEKFRSSSSGATRSSTSKILDRSASITSNNNFSDGKNRSRRRNSEVTITSGTLKFESRGKRKLRRRWDKWTDWSSCSVSCGKGRQIRWRYCIRDCDTAESEMEAKDCQLPACAPGKFLGIF